MAESRNEFPKIKMMQVSGTLDEMAKVIEMFFSQRREEVRDAKDKDIVLPEAKNSHIPMDAAIQIGYISDSDQLCSLNIVYSLKHPDHWMATVSKNVNDLDPKKKIVDLFLMVPLNYQAVQSIPISNGQQYLSSFLDSLNSQALSDRLAVVFTRGHTIDYACAEYYKKELARDMCLHRMDLLVEEHQRVGLHAHMFWLRRKIAHSHLAIIGALLGAALGIALCVLVVSGALLFTPVTFGISCALIPVFAFLGMYLGGIIGQSLDRWSLRKGPPPELIAERQKEMEALAQKKQDVLLRKLASSELGGGVVPNGGNSGNEYKYHSSPYSRPIDTSRLIPTVESSSTTLKNSL